MPLETFCLIVAFLFGINIGSFLNVAIWRLPRGGSIVEPQWSYCPRCEHRLGALDLFPVFSFLLLGRKCRYCKGRISWRYPAIELLTGLLFVAVTYKFGPTVDSVFYCLFVAALVCVFFIDLEHFVIPDGLNVLTVLIGIAHNLTAIYLHEPNQWVNVAGVHIPASIVGALGYAAVIYSIGLGYIVFMGLIGRGKNPVWAGWNYIKENVGDWAWITVYYAGSIVPPLRKFVEQPEPLEGTTADEIKEDEDGGAMGGGDGKLAAGIGANIFVALALQSMVWAVFLGAFFGLALIIKQRRSLDGRTAIPFGPWMVAGALIAMFVGNDILHWYVANFLTFPTTPLPPGNLGGTAP